MKRYKLSEDAEIDLAEAIDYIAIDRPLTAIQVLDDFLAAFDRIAEMPGLGGYDEDLLPRTHRFYTLHSYRVAYRWKITPIEIVAVIHGARDVRGVFKRRGLF